MAAWASVGIQCVCIDDTPRNPRWGGTERIVKDALYTVRSVRFTPKGVCMLTFQEIINPVVNVIGGGRMEWGFDAVRFRPVVPIAQDLALFAHHLTSTPIEEFV